MQHLKSKKGQGLVEYILIVALMGILSIAAVNALSTKTQKGFTAATNKLGTEFAKIGG
jgi:Flp pilus assembly pilin Flp